MPAMRAVAAPLLLLAGGAMDGIVASVQKVEAILQDMVGFARHQSEGVQDINHAVLRLDGNAQQNAALVEQLTHAVSALRTQIQSLAGAVRSFDVGQRASGTA